MTLIGLPLKQVRPKKRVLRRMSVFGKPLKMFALISKREVGITSKQEFSTPFKLNEMFPMFLSFTFRFYIPNTINLACSSAKLSPRIQVLPMSQDSLQKSGYKKSLKRVDKGCEIIKLYTKEMSKIHIRNITSKCSVGIINPGKKLSPTEFRFWEQ